VTLRSPNTSESDAPTTEKFQTLSGKVHTPCPNSPDHDAQNRNARPSSETIPIASAQLRKHPKTMPERVRACPNMSQHVFRNLLNKPELYATACPNIPGQPRTPFQSIPGRFRTVPGKMPNTMGSIWCHTEAPKNQEPKCSPREAPAPD
jgi:hypothetical protein